MTNQEILINCMKDVGISKETTTALTIALNQNKERIEDVKDYLFEQIKNQTDDSDKIVRKLMKMIMQ